MFLAPEKEWICEFTQQSIRAKILLESMVDV